MIKGIIFDLDGVIVSTDEYHFQAWKSIAVAEGILFDRSINERLRGVSRMESLEILLEQTKRNYTSAEKSALAERKNDFYRELLQSLSPKDILPGVNKAIQRLRQRGIKLAIGSSSKNTPVILEKIGMKNTFDALADGNQIKHSKPNPEVFLLAASKLGLSPSECLVIEDAEAGVSAALNGGMEVLAVGAAATDTRATYSATNLNQVVWL